MFNVNLNQAISFAKFEKLYLDMFDKVSGPEAKRRAQLEATAKMGSAEMPAPSLNIEQKQAAMKARSNTDMDAMLAKAQALKRVPPKGGSGPRAPGRPGGPPPSGPGGPPRGRPPAGRPPHDIELGIRA